MLETQRVSDFGTNCFSYSWHASAPRITHQPIWMSIRKSNETTSNSISNLYWIGPKIQNLKETVNVKVIHKTSTTEPLLTQQRRILDLAGVRVEKQSDSIPLPVDHGRQKFDESWLWQVAADGLALRFRQYIFMDVIRSQLVHQAGVAPPKILRNRAYGWILAMFRIESCLAPRLGAHAQLRVDDAEVIMRG